MKKSTDLPEQRRMPAALRDRIWDEIEPQLDPPANRFRSLRAPLAVAASVIVVALGVVFAVPQLRGNMIGSASGGHAPDPLVDQCIQNVHGDVPDPATWRAGARLDLDATNGFLVIRNDQYAAACVLENGKGAGVISGEILTNHNYGKLTAARPFDYLTSDNLQNESIHFGIAASDVVALSLEAPDGSKKQGIVADGTFIVRTPVSENSNQPSTNYVDATLANGQTVHGSLRN